MAEATERNPIVAISTTLGDFRLELFRDKAPITVENFLSYVGRNFYDGLVFHRVIPGFMVQGGGFDPAMAQKKADAPIKNEAGNGVKNTVGSIAMARTNVVDSATCQFFINVSDNEFLNHRGPTPDGFGYAVFGQVIEGLDVVRKIEKVKTASRAGHQDVPVEPVVINSVRLEPAA